MPLTGIFYASTGAHEKTEKNTVAIIKIKMKVFKNWALLKITLNVSSYPPYSFSFLIYPCIEF